jgi:hypothetical protein
MRRLLGTLILAGTLVTAGCAAEAGTPQPAPPTSALAAALAVVPDGAGGALATDHAAMKKRWGMSDITSATDTGSAGYDEYLDHLGDAIVAGGLVRTVATMAESYGWSWLDVDWAVETTTSGAPPAVVYKLRDDLDMSVVTSSLDKTYQRSGPDSRPVYELDLKKSGGVPPIVGDVVVLPDRHLVVGGNDPAPVLAVIDGTAPGLAATPTGQAMLMATPTAESLILGWDAGACLAAGRGSGSSATTSGGPDNLGRMDWWVTGVVDETHAMAEAGYRDPAAASADAPARATLVSTGRTSTSGLRYAEVLGPTTVSAAGSQVQYRMDAMPRSSVLAGMWARGDLPWAICGG